MVASLCGFGHKSPKRILPSTDQELKSDKEDVHPQRPETLTESIIKCMKPRCSWSIAKKKKIQPNVLHHHQQDTKQQQQKQQQQPLKDNSDKNDSFKTMNHHRQLVTLEEWILASPGPNDFQLSSYKKVYPSTDMQHRHERKSSLSRRLTVEGVLNGADNNTEVDYSSTSFTSHQSAAGKMKKKVSFRLPEVADIFILDDPLAH